jgi:DNA-binding transcriptional regulator YhcF (GntR family)
MQSEVVVGSESHQSRNGDGLSYKFQRLREKLREAVRSGELAGKLPGERALARRFHVNAKTLSKALTDLAAEGLLDRSIGRGTYVKGSNGNAKQTKWLIVCDAERNDSQLVRLFQEANAEAVVLNDLSAVRPSFLRQFDAVIDFGTQTPDAFIRDLVVRNVSLVSVNREPGMYSLNGVGTDRQLGGSCVARDLVLGGHRHIAVVESIHRSVVPAAVKQAAISYAPDASVHVCSAADVVTAVREGATAVVCDSTDAGREVRGLLEQAGLRIPEDVSLAAVGCCDDQYPSSGYFADVRSVAQSVVDLLRGGASHRPAAIWLAPHRVDRGTIRVMNQKMEEEAA